MSHLYDKVKRYLIRFNPDLPNIMAEVGNDDIIIAGVDTEGAKLDNEWKKIENRIQISRENIEASNVTAAEANAQKQ